MLVELEELRARVISPWPEQQIQCVRYSVKMEQTRLQLGNKQHAVHGVVLSHLRECTASHARSQCVVHAVSGEPGRSSCTWQLTQTAAA
jgi:hypothetical protein